MLTPLQDHLTGPSFEKERGLEKSESLQKERHPGGTGIPGESHGRSFQGSLAAPGTPLGPLALMGVPLF